MRLTIIPVAIQNDAYSPFNIPIIVTVCNITRNYIAPVRNLTAMAKNNSGKFGGPMLGNTVWHSLPPTCYTGKGKRLILVFSSESVSFTSDTIIATVNLTISDHLQRPL